MIHLKIQCTESACANGGKWHRKKNIKTSYSCAASDSTLVMRWKKPSKSIWAIKREKRKEREGMPDDDVPKKLKW